MATQTFYSQWLGNLRSYITVTEKSRDVNENRTLLSWSVYAHKTGVKNNPYNNFKQTPVQVTINGTRVYNANVNYDLNTGLADSKQLIASGETYVGHNSDGSKAVPISLMVDFSSTGTHWGYGKTSATGSMNLTTIPRASTFSLKSYSVDFDADIAMTINSNDSSFTHNVKYTQPNGATSIYSTIATTSATFKIPISLATQIPNATNYVSTITLETKNSSGTVIGSNTANVTVVLNATYKPSISALNPTGKNDTIDNNTKSTYHYLGGIDKVGTTITAEGSNGSTISFTEYRILNSSNAQVSNITVNGTGGASFTAPSVPSTNALFTLQARVADSRGRFSNWTSSSIKIRSHYYKKPSIWGVTVGRSTSNQNYMVGRVSWEITPVYQAGGTAGQINTASMKFRYRKKGVTSWTDLTTQTDLSKEKFPLSFEPTVFAQSDTFEFIGEITDKFGNKSQTAIVTVNGAFVHMDFGPKGVGIGKDHSDSNYDLEVGAGGVNSDGAIKINGFDISQGRHGNYKNFTVGGDANTYYPVAIKGQAQFGFHRYSITRGYNWDAPNTWHNNTHRGGLTLDIEWSGESASGGNDKYIRVIEFSQTYSAMVGGMDLGRGDDTSLIVWLRGGGALYRLYSEMGSMATINVHLGNLTDASGTVFPTRTSPVNSEIFNRYPVRSDGELYSLGHKVVSENNINQMLSGYAKKSDIPSVPSYSGGNNESNGYYIIGDYQVAYGSMPISAISGLKSTRGGSRNFYRAFGEVPYVQVSMDAQGEYLSGMAYVHSVTKTGFTAAIYDSSGFGTTQAQKRLINYFAIGRK